MLTSWSRDRTPTTRHAAEAGHLFKGRVASTTLVFPVRSSSRHSSVRPAAPLFPQTSRRVVRATRPAWVQELHPGRPKRGQKSAGMMHQIAWNVPCGVPSRSARERASKTGWVAFAVAGKEESLASASRDSLAAKSSTPAGGDCRP